MTVKAFSADATKTALDVGVSQTTALGAENTDGEIVIPLYTGFAEAGTWTPTIAAGLCSLTRTAAATTTAYWIDIPIPTRTIASKGIKPTGMTINYSMDTAVFAVDLRFELWKRTQGADGAAPTAAVLFGDDNADYDGDHNSVAERCDVTGAPELHKVTLIDAGAPAYVGAGETLVLRIFADDNGGGGTGDLVVTSAVLQYSETLVDLA